MNRQTSIFGSKTQHSAAGASLAKAYPITNPYQGINWETVLKVKANLHTHSTDSDGTAYPHYVIDTYNANGYGILAITDHDYGYNPDRIAFPWETLSAKEAAWENRTPSTLGMVAVPGVEVSYPRHVLSLFCEYTGEGQHDTATAIAAIAAAGGYAAMAHPAYYANPYAYCQPLYAANSCMIALEVENAGLSIEAENAEALWDQLLTDFMPSRPIWGIANDDAHGMPGGGNYTSLTGTLVARCWNTFFISELTPEKVRSCYESGAFIYSRRTDQTAPNPPVITSITDTGTAIVVEATGYDTADWISEGTVVETGLSYDYIANQINKYVRLRLKTAVTDGKLGWTATQPFGRND